MEGIQSDFSRKTRTKSRFVSCIADSVVIVMLSLWHADPSRPSYVFLSKRSGSICPRVHPLRSAGSAYWTKSAKERRGTLTSECAGSTQSVIAKSDVNRAAWGPGCYSTSRQCGPGLFACYDRPLISISELSLKRVKPRRPPRCLPSKGSQMFLPRPCGGEPYGA